MVDWRKFPYHSRAERGSRCWAWRSLLPLSWDVFAHLGISCLEFCRPTCFVRSGGAWRRLSWARFPAAANGSGQRARASWGFNINFKSKYSMEISPPPAVKLSTNTLPSSAACSLKPTPTWVRRVDNPGRCVSTEIKRAFVYGFAELDFRSGKRGVECGKVISHDSGLFVYRWANELRVLTRRLDEVARMTYCILIWA